MQRYRPLGTKYSQVPMKKIGPSTQMVVFGIGNRLWFPQLIDLKEEILREFHCSHFAVHPGGTKMYRDLHRQYYWSGMN